MKAKRQKHKAAKARSLTARAAKKLETKASSDSETNDVTQTIEPLGKKPKLERPSSPEKLVKRQTRSSKGSQTTDAKVKLKSKLAGEGKKRKEVTNCFTHPPLQRTTMTPILSLDSPSLNAPVRVFKEAASAIAPPPVHHAYSLPHHLLLLFISLPPEGRTMIARFSSVSL